MSCAPYLFDFKVELECLNLPILVPQQTPFKIYPLPMAKATQGLDPVSSIKLINFYPGHRPEMRYV